MKSLHVLLLLLLALLISVFAARIRVPATIGPVPRHQQQTIASMARNRVCIPRMGPAARVRAAIAARAAAVAAARAAAAARERQAVARRDRAAARAAAAAAAAAALAANGQTDPVRTALVIISIRHSAGVTNSLVIVSNAATQRSTSSEQDSRIESLRAAGSHADFDIQDVADRRAQVLNDIIRDLRIQGDQNVNNDGNIAEDLNDANNIMNGRNGNQDGNGNLHGNMMNAPNFQNIPFIGAPVLSPYEIVQRDIHQVLRDITVDNADGMRRRFRTLARQLHYVGSNGQPEPFAVVHEDSIVIGSYIQLYYVPPHWAAEYVDDQTPNFPSVRYESYPEGAVVIIRTRNVGESWRLIRNPITINNVYTWFSFPRAAARIDVSLLTLPMFRIRSLDDSLPAFIDALMMTVGASRVDFNARNTVATVTFALLPDARKAAFLVNGLLVQGAEMHVEI